MIHKFSFKIIRNNIQLELLIDDIAKILRIEFWFIPKIEFIEIIINNIINILFEYKYDIIIIGAIFCQVNIKKHEVQFKPSIIEGNQRWKGIKLNFINKGKIMIIFSLLIKKNDLLINKINNIIEANAWIKKYFIVDSKE